MGTIAEKLTAVANSKAAIASAITGKGGTVPTKFSDYGTAVSSLPNTYSSGDEGKVVSSGALVSQTSLSVTSNNTYDTTTKNSVVVAVPNTYAAGDEGKVVSSGELVAQTSRNIDQNGTYDTTTNNSVTVNVSGGGGGGDSLAAKMITNAATPTRSLSASDFTSMGVTTIGDGAFYKCKWLTSVDLTGMTGFGSRSFEECSALTSVKLPTGSSWAEGEYVFQNCTALTSIDLSVTGKTGFYMFGNCTGLTSVTIPSNVTSLGSSCFSRCTGLTSFTLPNTVTNVASSILDGCSNIQTVTIEDGRTTIKFDGFCKNCTSLTTVNLPSDLTVWDGGYMFENCNNLTYIRVPDSLTDLGGGVQSGWEHRVFLNSYLATIDFGSTRSTIPTLHTTNVFQGMKNSNYQILVPAALLTDWQAANNWSSIASHIVAHP